MAQIDEDWLEHAGQQSDRECAADHRDRERPLGLCAPIPRRQRRRQETQAIDEVGRHRREAAVPLSVPLMMDSTKGCP